MCWPRQGGPSRVLVAAVAAGNLPRCRAWREGVIG